MTDPGSPFDVLALASSKTLGELRAAPLGFDVAGGSVLVATDADGLRHLLVPAGEEAVNSPDVGAAVTLRYRRLVDGGSESRFLDVACEQLAFDRQFDVICREMGEELALNPASDVFRTCRKVLDRWRALLRRDQDGLLTDSALAGLLGELLWLDRVARVEPGSALSCWAGPDGGTHDFLGTVDALEVKTTTKEESSITVNGHQQLEPPEGGNLWLCVVWLRPPDQTAVSVPDLLDSIVARGVDEVALLEKMALVGYDTRHRKTYDTRRWVVAREEVRLVDEAFPRITPSTCPHVGAGAIDRVTYGLELDGCPAAVDTEPHDLVVELVGDL